MADPNEFDDVMPENTAQHDPGLKVVEENLWSRLFSSIIIWMMIQIAGTLIAFVTVIQFLFLLADQKKPNPRLAQFGEDLGIWVAKAVRYQAGASEVKPWPWTELD